MNKTLAVIVHIPYPSWSIVNLTGGRVDDVITAVALVVIAAVAMWFVRKSRTATTG
jgi:hypothetical protein